MALTRVPASGIVTSTSFTFNSINVTATTVTSSTGTGALVLAGGLGVGGGAYIGGNLTVLGSINATLSGIASQATNLAGGTAGQIPYQTAAGATSFTGPGTFGQLLMSTGAGSPTYQSTLTIVNGVVTVSGSAGTVSTTTGALVVTGGLGVGAGGYFGGTVTATNFAGTFVGNLTGTASTSTSAAFAYATTGTLTAGSGLSGSAFNGSSNVTWTLNTATLMQSATQVVQSHSTGTGILGSAFNGSTAQTWSLDTSTLMARAVQTVQSLSAGAGLTGSAFNGSTAQTWTLNTATLMANAVSATTANNLAGGSAGQFAYQTAPGTTAFVSTGSMYVYRATMSDSASGTAGSVANSVTFNNSNSGAASGSTFNGSSALTVSANTLGALSLSGGGTVSGAVTFSGPVIFNGTATYALSTNTYYTDNILELHVPASGVSTPWFADDGKDIGFRFHYYTNSTDTNAALVLANDTKWLEWYNAGAEGTSTFAGSNYGDFKTGGIWATRNVGIGYTSAQSGAVLSVNGGAYVNGTVTATLFSGSFSGSITGTASTATSAAFAYSTTGTHTAGTGLSGSTFNGSSNVTWTLNTATLMSNAVTAINLAGGNTGQFAYQTGAGTTAFVSTGSMYVNRAVTADAALSAGALTFSHSTGTGILGSAYNGSANQTWTLDTSTLMARAVQTVQSLTPGTGLSGTAFNGSTAYTWTLNTSTLMNIAVNLTGGAAGSLVYQSGANATTNLAIGTSGYVLQSNGTAPTWVAASTITAGTASQTANSLTAGTGLSGSAFNGSAAVTWTLNTATLMASAVSLTGNITASAPQLAAATESNSIYITAPSYTTDKPVKLINFDWYGNMFSMGNIRSGSTPSNGFGLYYTASGGSITELLRVTTSGALSFGSSGTAYGTAGQVLQSNGNASPTWVNVSGLSAGSASQVQTISQSANATYYPTFVSANNGSATAMSLYTTGAFTINPATSALTIGGQSYINFSYNGPSGSPASSFQSAHGYYGINNTGGSVWYNKIAQLPASTSATFDFIRLRVTVNQGWGAASSYSYDITLANRNGFSYYWEAHRGNITDGTGIVAYAEAGGATTVYMKLANSYDYITCDILDSSQITVYQQSWTTTAPTGTLNFDTSAPGTYPPSLAIVGAATFTGEVTAYSSDRRLKTNIRPITDAVSKVQQLNGIIYNWNDIAAGYGFKEGEDIVGVFAQDVEQVLPEATKPAPFDVAEDGTSKSGENYKTVQYEKLVPLLIEAIKELKAEIEVLKASK